MSPSVFDAEGRNNAEDIRLDLIENRRKAMLRPPAVHLMTAPSLLLLAVVPEEDLIPKTIITIFTRFFCYFSLSVHCY
jgi:hypothetical protein